MRFPRKRGSTSVRVRVFIPDNSVATGAGCTGITYTSTNLAVAYSRENDTGGTEVTGANILDITTIGTWADPGAGKVRIKAVDATKFPGLYEIHLPDSAAFGAADTSQNVIINVYEKTTTALKVGPNMVMIPLSALNVLDGESAVQSIAAGSIVTATFGACVPPAPSDMATESSLTIVLNRIGAFAGTGVNTILGFFLALMRKDTGITTPSDVGGSYNHAANSNQAIAEELVDMNMRIANVDSNVGSSASAILAYVDCLPATWVTVPTAAENAFAVLDEAKGTHTGLLAGLTFTTPNRVDASATATVDGQSVADAMKITPSAGTAAAGSVQAKLDAVAKPGDAMDLLDTIMRST